MNSKLFDENNGINARINLMNMINQKNYLVKIQYVLYASLRFKKKL